MDEQKPPSEEKDAATPAHGAVAVEEMGSAEGEPLKPPEGASAGPEPESTDTKGPAQAGSTPARRCALCNCGDWSPHGQRELQRFEPAPDWPERLGGHDPPGGPGQPPPDPDLDPVGAPSAQIGFSERVTPAQLFEPTGHCWVHRCCAAWSAGVGQAAAGLAGVGRAVFSGISQKCEHCRRRGATIPCRGAGCPRLYHFPCAATSGCFQSAKTLRLLCPQHAAQAPHTEDARCSACRGPGDLRDLVLCTGCGQHYHGGCLGTTLTPRKRSGWQCPECKVCQTCRRPGEDPTMLVCEVCDKGWHTFCTDPATQGLPAGSWRCKDCRVCSDCSRCPAELDPGCQWSRSSSLCQGCRQRRTAEDAHGAPDPPTQMLASPGRGELTDVPVPSPKLEPVDEKLQPGGDPEEAPSGDGGSPPGKLTPVEVPPSEMPPDELPLEKPPPDELSPDVQPPEDPPPLVQHPEDPPPLVQHPED
ncbi:histone-lysine N-methyltransferase 2D-like, partial [Podargus strigoides]